MTGLADSNKDMRTTAAEVLGWLGAAMPKAGQQALVVQLADPDEDVREAAAWALGRLGVAMPDAVRQSKVVQRAAPVEDDVWRAAMWALKGLGAAMPDAGQQALVARLADPMPAVQKAATWVLKGLGPAMPARVQQALVAALLRKDIYRMSQSAAEALSSAQQQGLRIFRDGTDEGTGRLVSDLSATASFADACTSFSRAVQVVQSMTRVD